MGVHLQKKSFLLCRGMHKKFPFVPGNALFFLVFFAIFSHTDVPIWIKGLKKHARKIKDFNFWGGKTSATKKNSFEAKNRTYINKGSKKTTCRLKLFRIWLKIYYPALYPYPTKPQIVDFCNFPLFLWNWVWLKKNAHFFSFFSLEFPDLKGNWNSLVSKQTGIPCYDNQVFFYSKLWVFNSLTICIVFRTIPWYEKKLEFLDIFNFSLNSLIWQPTFFLEETLSFQFTDKKTNFNKTKQTGIPCYDSNFFIYSKLLIFNSLTKKPRKFSLFHSIPWSQKKVFFYRKLSVFNSLTKKTQKRKPWKFFLLCVHVKKRMFSIVNIEERIFFRSERILFRSFFLKNLKKGPACSAKVYA